MEKLRLEHCWCVRDAQKRPFQSVDTMGKPNDRNTWLSFDDANCLYRDYPDKFAGLGCYFSLREGSDRLCLCGIDIDAIEHDRDRPNPLADEILTMFQETYAERSPSGTGYHIICNIDRDVLPFSRETNPYYEKNPNNSIEVYIGELTNRYFTYTGEKLESHSNTITDQTENVLFLLQKYMRKPTKAKRTVSRRPYIPIVAETQLDDEEIERRLNLIHQSARGKQFTKLYKKGTGLIILPRVKQILHCLPFLFHGLKVILNPLITLFVNLHFI